MSANWLIRKQQRELARLSAYAAVNKLAIAEDKSRLTQLAAEKLASPLGLAGCFSAGCATEWLVEKQMDGMPDAKQWAEWSTRTLALFNEFL